MNRQVSRAIYDKFPIPIVRFGLWIYANTYVPIFASGKETYDLGGFKMKINQNESFMMINRRFRHYESEVSEIITNRLTRGSTYVDIGSNKGYHVLEAANVVGSEGCVYSFEPNPNNFTDLKENINLNKFQNVCAFKKAIYDRVGTFSFRPGEKSGHGSIAQEGNFETETITFDDFLIDNDINIDMVDLIKIDVEGSEASVIIGMTDFLSKSEDCMIVVEVHNNADIKEMSKVLIENSCDFKKRNGYWLITT